MKSIITIEKPVYCKSCFEEIHLSPFRRIVERESFLCDKCIKAIQSELAIKKIFGIEVLFLSGYDGIMKKWLMNYKEYKDIELAPCFLFPFLPLLKFKYPSRLFLPLPSSQERIEMRGFSHLGEILSASHLPYLEIFTKEDREQKESKLQNRLKKQGIRLKERRDLSSQKIVLFDDVLTTGSTLKESIEVISALHPKKIQALILLDNYHTEKMRIH